MTLLDALTPTRKGRSTTPGDPASEAPAEARTEPLLTGRHRGLAGTIGLVLLAGVLVLVFGPARGMRNDIHHVSGEITASRAGIYSQLDTVRAQLDVAKSSLTMQEQGLQVAVQTQKDTGAAVQSTQAILDQTRQALALVQQVAQALGPLDQFGGKVDTVVQDVQQTVQLGQAALAVAQQTLSTGQQALSVAKDTLATLQRSEQIQAELLATAKATLEQTRQINAKIPGAPVFPTAPAPTAP